MRSLVSAAAVAQTYGAGKLPDVDYAKFCKHSIATGLAAKAIAKQLGSNQDHAFLTGLLHNIGCLVLASCAPARYAEALRWGADNNTDLAAAEMQILGIDHMTAGTALLRYWNLPAAIVHTLSLPSADNMHEHSQAAALVTLADAIAYGLDMTGGAYDRVPVISQAAWDFLGLQETALLEIFASTESQFAETIAILGIDGNP